MAPLTLGSNVPEEVHKSKLLISFAYMNPYKYKISVRLRHPSSSLRSISQVLGEMPGLVSPKLMDVGEQRTSSAGDVLEGTYRESLYSFSFMKEWQSSDSQSLPDELVLTLNRLASQKEVLEEVTSTGGKMEFFIGITIDANSGISLGSDLIMQLSDMKVELDFDIYPPDSK